MFGLGNPELGVLMLFLFVVFIMLGFPIAFTLMAMGARSFTRRRMGNARRPAVAGLDPPGPERPARSPWRSQE